MHIQREPIRPTSWQLQEHGRAFPPNYLHESWRDYLYWDVELRSLVGASRGTTPCQKRFHAPFPAATSSRSSASARLAMTNPAASPQSWRVAFEREGVERLAADQLGHRVGQLDFAAGARLLRVERVA